ncbi:MAG: hypothetical protein J7M38_12620, partial [Armatimonadetes bacterium]|nr:hypothetical protein [Armatimonadota bacterium]
GEMLDRPPVVITCPAEGVEGAPRPNYRTQAFGDLDEVVAQVDAHVSGIYWGGDAMPQFSPSFGPDNFACFLGAELDWSDDEEIDTSWAVPYVERWEDALPLTLQEDGPWWTRMVQYMEKLSAAAEGKWLVSHIDMHSNMDALVSIRGATELCGDLYLHTDLVTEANNQVRALYPIMHDILHEAGGMDRCGTGAGWIRAWCAGKCNTLQCDFAALIGPEHFRQFVMPALEEEAAHLEHCIYHWDGPTALVHLDDLMSIEGIECIQWVPGSGAAPFIEWIDLLAEVQKRGKSVMVYCSVEQLPTFHKALRPDRLFYHVSAPDRETLQRTLEWVNANS